MRLQLVLAFALLVGIPSISCSEESNDEPGVGNQVLEVLKTGVEKVREFAEPHVRNGYSRAKGFLVGDEGSRAPRTTDVTIVNQSGRTFSLSRDHCNSGKFSEGILPPGIINPTSQVAYGTESNSALRGTECGIKYTSQDGSWFSLETSNPYLGYNSLKADASSTLRIQESLGSGHHNEVMITITSAF